MAEGTALRPPAPALETTTRLFARGLGWSPQQLRDAFGPATAEDLPALLAFRRRQGWDDAAYLRWRYGLEAEPGTAPGQMWRLRAGDEVLAVIGRESQPVQYGGRTYSGQLLMDIQLRPDLESTGGGVWLNQMLFPQAEVTLAVGANSRSLSLVQRLFAPLPHRNYWLLPLDSAAILRQKGIDNLLARVGAPVLDAGWSLAHRHARGQKHAGIEVVETDRVAADWLEALRGALPAQTACVLPAAEHLQWRLFGNPRARYRLLVAHRGGTCAGYLALRVLSGNGNGNGGGVSGLHLLDWKLAEAGAEAALAALLQSAIALARAERCSKVFTTALDARALPILKRLGFLVRSSPLLVAGVRADVPVPGAGGAGSWQITDLSYDSDGGY